jgi:hypothetical protein
MCINTTQTVQQLPATIDLDRLCRYTAEQVYDEAESLADLCSCLTRDLTRGELFALLRNLATAGLQIHQLCC